MHFLVTGAAGFIGRCVVRFLVARGHRVTAFIRHMPSTIPLLHNKNIEYITYELESEVLPPLPSDIETAIHLAWGNLAQYKDPVHTKHHAPLHYTFLHSLLDSGIRHFLVAGTSFEYGLQEGKLREDAPCAPVTEYGKGKLALYERFSKLCSKHNALLQWVRPFYIYAEDQRPQSLLGQISAAYESGAKEFNMSQGDQLRDYLHVDAVADAIVRIALQKSVTDIINIGSGEGTAVATMVQRYLAERGAILQLNKGFYPYPDYEPFAFWADTKKLNQLYE